MPGGNTGHAANRVVKLSATYAAVGGALLSEYAARLQAQCGNLYASSCLPNSAGTTNFTPDGSSVPGGGGGGGNGVVCNRKTHDNSSFWKGKT